MSNAHKRRRRRKMDPNQQNQNTVVQPPQPAQGQMPAEQAPPAMPPQNATTAAVPPANAPAAAMTQLQPGSQVMAKRPVPNSVWEMAVIETQPGNPSVLIVAFPDNARFYAQTVEISPVAMANVQPEQATPAAESLKPDYATFRELLVNMDQKCQQIFDMPIDMLLIQIHRNAVQQELPGVGKMASVGGMSQFVPDGETLTAWTTSYLLRVQERERQAGAPAE